MVIMQQKYAMTWLLTDTATGTCPVRRNLTNSTRTEMSLEVFPKALITGPRQSSVPTMPGISLFPVEISMNLANPATSMFVLSDLFDKRALKVRILFSLTGF